MAALRSRCGHYIFALWFLFISIFFLAYSRPSQIGCLPYFHTWCGFSANLGCRSEMCCMRLAQNTGHKIRHLGTITQLCRAICSLIEKNLLNSNIPSTWSHQYGELRPITGWDRFTSLGHPTKFQRVSRLVFVTAATSLTGGQRNLHGVWPSPGLVHYIYIFRGSCPLTEFCLVQNKLSYIGSVTARHSSSGRQPNFAAWYNEWNYGTFAEGAAYIRLGGHQFEHRPTF